MSMNYAGHISVRVHVTLYIYIDSLAYSGRKAVLTKVAVWTPSHPMKEQDVPAVEENLSF